MILNDWRCAGARVLYQTIQNNIAVYIQVSRLGKRFHRDAMLLFIHSFIDGTFTVTEDHKVIMIDLVSYDINPRLLDHIDNVILERQVKARRREAEDMRRVRLKGCFWARVAKSAQLVIPHGPQHNGLGSFCLHQPVNGTFEKAVALRACEGDGAIYDTCKDSSLAM